MYRDKTYFCCCQLQPTSYSYKLLRPVGQVNYEIASEAASVPEISHLPNKQQEELATLLSTFPDLFTEQPGYTDIIQHNIILIDKQMICQCMYQIPENLLPVLKEVLNVMLC